MTYSWSDEDSEEVDPGEIPARLEQLAENNPPPLPNEGNARQRRIRAMEDQISELGEFINDCDRYKEQTREVQTVKADVRLMMDQYLAQMRAKAVTKGKQIHQELQYVKAITK